MPNNTCKGCVNFAESTMQIDGKTPICDIDDPNSPRCNQYNTIIERASYFKGAVAVLDYILKQGLPINREIIQDVLTSVKPKLKELEERMK